MGVRRGPRHGVTGAVTALLLGTATQAVAQQTPEPLPPQPDTTTVVEPIAEPDAPPAEVPPKEPVNEGPAHVPPDA